MPTKDEHVAQLRRNHAFLKECEEKCHVSTAYSDWLCVVRFYICVHIVEAILATVNQHSDNHDDRFTRVSRLKNQFKDDFEKHYRDLYNTSILARYSTKAPTRLTPDRLKENETSFNYIVSYAKDKFGITIEKPTLPATL